MKKTTILITALIMLFVGAPQAKAVPMYYTFAGDVYNSVDGGTGYIGAQFPGLAIGDIVTYTVILDFDAGGTIRYNNGVTTTHPSDPYDYFYTDAYSGDYLVSTGGGSHNLGTDISEYNYGYDRVGSYGVIYVNSEDERLYIYSPSLSPSPLSPSLFSNMIAGYSVITGHDYAYNANGDFSLIESNLTLMSILPVSVPEPSILLLLGSGLLGLGMFRRMRQEG